VTKTDERDWTETLWMGGLYACTPSLSGNLIRFAYIGIVTQPNLTRACLLG
jgi:hypothetical protein